MIRAQRRRIRSGDAADRRDELGPSGAAAIVVHRLVDGEYQRREHSEVIPALDLAELARSVQPGENQTELVRAYQAALRSR